MKAVTTGMLLAALVMLIISVQSTPVSAEGTAPETSAITKDDLDDAYAAGHMEGWNDREDIADLDFEDGYYAALEDAGYDGPCNPLDVSSGDIPPYRIDQLKAAGYTADPTDGREALYPPNC